ncbi:cupin domain-containing protein, partial [Aspergillus homomorphus CBS 101889]
PKSYTLPKTNLTPNSPKPLLHYKNTFLTKTGHVDAALAYDTFARNGWDVQWVTTYGRTQKAHYHPATHEVMVVLSGPGTIRWGVSDLDPYMQEHARDELDPKEKGNGGFEMQVQVGDCFVIPAGVAHKSFDDAAASLEPTCLTGGGAHRIEAEDPRGFVAALQVEGFTMMGAYPRGFTWGWAEGGEHVGDFESVWGVENPQLDPVCGGKGGIGAFWEGCDGVDQPVAGKAGE